MTKKKNLNQVKNVKSRSITKYFLSSDNGEHKEVCRPFLIECLQITPLKLKNATDTAISNPTAIELRGSFPKKKTNEKDLHHLDELYKKNFRVIRHITVHHRRRKNT